LNKFAENFEENDSDDRDDIGSKWSLTALKRYFKSNNIDDRKLWKDVNDLLVKSVLSVEQQLSTMTATHVKQ
jgi:hypothetical protein